MTKVLGEIEENNSFPSACGGHLLPPWLVWVQIGPGQRGLYQGIWGQLLGDG